MGYSITRAIIQIVLIILAFFWGSITRKRNSKNIKLKFSCVGVLVLTIIMVLGFFPFENLYLSFNSVEKAFKYKYSNKKIVEIFNYKGFSTVIYRDDTTLQAMNFSKKNGKWKLMLEKKAKKTYVHNNECPLLQYSTPSNLIATIVICIDTDSRINEEVLKEYSVTDSKGIALKKEFFKDHYRFYAMLEDDEPFITINGEKIMLK